MPDYIAGVDNRWRFPLTPQRERVSEQNKWGMKKNKKNMSKLLKGLGKFQQLDWAGGGE